MLQVQIFQKHNDTVLTLGLSHVSCNDEIFSTSDLSIGIDDILVDAKIAVDSYNCKPTPNVNNKQCHDGLDRSEVLAICSIAAHSCIFNFSLGRSGLLHLLSEGRAALNAGTSAGLFMVTSYLSFSFFILLSACSVLVPFVPSFGSALLLQCIVPFVVLSMSFTRANHEMRIVQQKNDESMTFSSGEQRRLCTYAILRAIPPALFPHLIYLMSMGFLMIEHEVDFLTEECNFLRDNLLDKGWFTVIRCNATRAYSGPIRITSGCLMLAEFALCIIFLSSTFVFRLKYLSSPPPWTMNLIWIVTCIICIVLVFIYVVMTVERISLAALPWYFYFIALCFPLMCVMISEIVKVQDIRHERRAENFRRLQFETKLGMWSPK